MCVCVCLCELFVWLFMMKMSETTNKMIDKKLQSKLVMTIRRKPKSTYTHTHSFLISQKYEPIINCNAICKHLQMKVLLINKKLNE